MYARERKPFYVLLMNMYRKAWHNEISLLLNEFWYNE